MVLEGSDILYWIPGKVMRTWWRHEQDVVSYDKKSSELADMHALIGLLIPKLTTFAVTTIVNQRNFLFSW